MCDFDASGEGNHERTFTVIRQSRRCLTAKMQIVICLIGDTA